VSVYVAYRSQDTDENTVTDVLEDLQDNNTHVSQFVDFQAENCQEAESSAERRSSA
jgi:pyridoxine 5'-phosphate synthase PdxJ